MAKKTEAARPAAIYYYDNGAAGLTAVPCETGSEPGALFRPGEDQPFTTGAILAASPASGCYVLTTEAPEA